MKLTRTLVTTDEVLTYDVHLDYQQLEEQVRKAAGSKTQASRDGAVIVRITGRRKRTDN